MWHGHMERPCVLSMARLCHARHGIRQGCSHAHDLYCHVKGMSICCAAGLLCAGQDHSQGLRFKDEQLTVKAF